MHPNILWPSLIFGMRMLRFAGGSVRAAKYSRARPRLRRVRFLRCAKGPCVRAGMDGASLGFGG